MDIIIYERENNYSPAGFGPAYHKLTYEVENTGKRSIKLLVLQAEWYNEAGNPIKNEKTYVVSSSTATFLPGQIRCAYFISDFPANSDKFSTYQISVIEIE